MNKMIKKANYLGIALLSLTIASCSDDGDSKSTTPAPGGTSNVTNSYSGSATYGDLVTFSINKTNQSYTLYNETTSQTSSGSYSVMDNEFSGIYEVSANGSTFFGVELDDKIAVGNFPSGNSNNDLTFGLSSEIDNSSQVANFPGNYFYVKLGSYLQTSPMEWGQFTLTADSMHAFTMDKGTNGPEDTTINFPIRYNNSNLDGSWQLSGSNSDRIDMNLEGTPVTGYAYSVGTTSVFLIDLGTGQGSVIAYKVDPNATLANIADSYKFIEFYMDGEKGAGNYTLSSNGSVTYSYTNGNPADIVRNASLLSNFQQVNSQLPNVYYAYNVDADGNNLYFVVAGDAIMHYHFDANFDFLGYGAGAAL